MRCLFSSCFSCRSWIPPQRPGDPLQSKSAAQSRTSFLCSEPSNPVLVFLVTLMAIQLKYRTISLFMSATRTFVCQRESHTHRENDDRTGEKAGNYWQIPRLAHHQLMAHTSSASREAGFCLFSVCEKGFILSDRSLRDVSHLLVKDVCLLCPSRLVFGTREKRFSLSFTPTMSRQREERQSVRQRNLTSSAFSRQSHTHHPESRLRQRLDCRTRLDRWQELPPLPSIPL